MRRGRRSATGTYKRLIEDEDLRGNLLAAYGAARGAYGRMSNGKPASKAMFEDGSCSANCATRRRRCSEASNALTRAAEEGKRRRKGGLGRTLALLTSRRCWRWR